MIADKLILEDMASKFIDAKCEKSNQKGIGEPLKFKSYLHKDESNCFTVIDSNYCIKCLFEKKFLENYFSTYPSYSKLDHFDGMLIFIKKAVFDILFFKNVNKTISYRIVLIIKEFDLDIAQKLGNEVYAKPYENINSLPQIESKMEKFYYNYLKEKAANFYKENYFKFHSMITPQHFIENKFPESIRGLPKVNESSNNSPFYSVFKVFQKGKIFTLLDNDEMIFDNFDPKQTKTKKSSADILKEIVIDEEDFENIEEEEMPIENNITIENLKNLDFSSLFYKHPSQKDKKQKDFSEFEIVDLQAVNTYEFGKEEEEGNPKDEQFLNKKKGREEENLDLPEDIRKLIKKMEGKAPLNAEIFEKYKSYKKFNSNTYVRENEDDSKGKDNK